MTIHPNQLKTIGIYMATHAIDMGYFRNRMPTLPFSIFVDDVLNFANEMFPDITDEDLAIISATCFDKYSDR